MRARVLVASGALFLGLWGLGWCLPERARLERVLPPEALTPDLRRALAEGWSSMNARLGADIVLNPESWSYGFSETAVVEPGWTEVPPLLLNSARAFYLRSGHEDEPNLLRAVARLRPTLEGLNPRIYFYGGGYMYGLAAWIAAGAALTPARLVRGVEWYMEEPARMAWLYLLGRSFSVAAYLATAWLLWSTGRRFFSEEAGLAAAALWAAAPGIVVQAHYMKPHLMGAFFTLAAFRLSAEALKGGPRWGVAAGAAAGLAASAVNHLGSAAVFPALAALWRARAGRPWRGEAAWLAASAGACVLSFLLTTPYLVLEPAVTLAAMREVGRFAGLSAGNLAVFLLDGLPSALTWPGALLVLVGLAAAWRRRADPPRSLALCGLVLLFPTVILSQSVHALDSIRYVGASTVALLLAGAAAADRGRAGLGAAAACALLAAAHSAVLDANLGLDRPGRSTRDAAGAWIEREVPAGSELGLLRLPQPSNVPTFRWDRYRLRFVQPEAFARAQGPVPEWLVLTHPNFDDRRTAGPGLARYALVESFPPAGPAFLLPPPGEGYGNPLVEIYRRRPST